MILSEGVREHARKSYFWLLLGLRMGFPKPSALGCPAGTRRWPRRRCVREGGQSRACLSTLCLWSQTWPRALDGRLSDGLVTCRQAVQRCRRCPDRSRAPTPGPWPSCKQHLPTLFVFLCFVKNWKPCLPSSLSYFLPGTLFTKYRWQGD